MKLKGLTKLALSGVALAAVAATLGTSTYAWYVTNSTAKVNGISGKVSSTGAGNIMVAQASTAQTAVHGHGDFQPEITLDTSNITNTTTGGLIPTLPIASDAVATTVTGTTSTAGTITYNKVETLLSSTTKWVDAKGKVQTVPAADSTAAHPYIQFDIWLLNTDSSAANFEYKIVNTTQSANDLVNQLAYSSNGAPVAQGELFNANIVDALRIGYTQTNYKSTTTYAYNETSDTTAQGGKTYYTKDGENYVVANLYNAETETYAFVDGTTYYEKSSSGTTYNDVTAGDTGLTVSPTASTILDAAASAKINLIQNASEVTFNQGGNAIDYYRAVMGNEEIVTSATTCTSGKSQVITLNQNEETKLSFYIWLEGSDAQCFDSVQGQSFELQLSFLK